jgi:hypothetical protein
MFPCTSTSVEAMDVHILNHHRRVDPASSELRLMADNELPHRLTTGQDDDLWTRGQAA